MTTQSKITTDLSLDDPVQLTAGTRFGNAERRLLDNQVLGIEQHLIDCLIKGCHATFAKLDLASEAVEAGDTVCAASVASSVPKVTKSTSDALASALAATGVVLRAAAPGAYVLVAFGGLVGPEVTGLDLANAGYVRVDTATSKCERVGTLGPSDYGIGIVDDGGWMTVAPAVSNITFTGSTSPGGATGDIQYNDAGAFEGTADLHWDATQKALMTAGGSATGAGSIAVGDGATASGDSAIAIGRDCEASGISSVSIGKQNTANAASTVAIGEANFATGNNSTAIGFGSVASAVFATALGEGCVASGAASISLGAGSNATRPGEYARSSSNAWNMEGDHRIDMYCQALATPTPLTLFDSSAFFLENSRLYSLRIRMLAVNSDSDVSPTSPATKWAHEVRELLIINDSTNGTLITDNNLVGGAPAPGFSSQGWSLTISAPGSNEIRFTFDPGSDNVQVGALLEWTAIGNLAL